MELISKKKKKIRVCTKVEEGHTIVLPTANFFNTLPIVLPEGSVIVTSSCCQQIAKCHPRIMDTLMPKLKRTSDVHERCTTSICYLDVHRSSCT